MKFFFRERRRNSLGLIVMVAVLLLAEHSFAGEERILFSSYTDNGWELQSIRADGSRLKTISWVENNVRSPAILADRFEVAAVTEKRNLQVYSSETAVATLSLPTGIYAQPAWSSDGTTLAYVQYKVLPSDQSDIWQIKRDTNGQWQEPEQLSKFPPMRLHPSYSPDGQQLLYTEFRRDRLLGVIEELGVYSFKEKKFTLLTGDEADSFYGRWSPDGKHIVYVSDKSGNYDVWLLSLEAVGALQGTHRQITSDTHFDGEPAWSPDGRQIAFVSTRSGAREIWLLSIDGGVPRQVTKSGKNNKEPVWFVQ